MNENNLNYYSRNSPVKKRKQLHDGGLLTSSKPSYSVQVTSRTYVDQKSDRIYAQS